MAETTTQLPHPTSSTPAAQAGYGRLGDRPVARLGYGAMRLSGPDVMGPPAVGEGQAVAVLRRAVELGVNHLDTSDYYGPHTVNRLIRTALSPYPEDLVIVTKVGYRRTPGGGWLPAGTPAELRGAVEDNLRNLGVDRLDVVNLRAGEGVQSADGSIERPFTVLAELQAEGLIRHLGLSTVTAAQLAEAGRIAPVVCVQNMFNLAQQEDAPMVAACAAAGIAYVPYFPLGGFSPLADQRLATVAARHGATPMQVALAWLLARSPAVLVIPGTSQPGHLEQNVAAAALRLTAADLAELDSGGTDGG